MGRIGLRPAVEALQAAYGPPAPPRPADPWHWVLWENVAYLADDDRRAAAFSLLKKSVGVRPEQIAAAPDEALLAAARFGIMPASRVEKMRRCAAIALAEFDGDLRPILDLPVPKALRA